MHIFRQLIKTSHRLFYIPTGGACLPCKSRNWCIRTVNFLYVNRENCSFIWTGKERRDNYNNSTF